MTIAHRIPELESASEPRESPTTASDEQDNGPTPLPLNRSGPLGAKRRARVVTENLTDRFLTFSEPLHERCSNICINLPTPLNRPRGPNHFAAFVSNVTLLLYDISVRSGRRWGL